MALPWGRGPHLLKARVKEDIPGGQGEAKRGEKTESGYTSGEAPWAEGFLLGQGEDKGVLPAAKSRRSGYSMNQDFEKLTITATDWGDE